MSALKNSTVVCHFDDNGYHAVLVRKTITECIRTTESLDAHYCDFATHVDMLDDTTVCETDADLISYCQENNTTMVIAKEFGENSSYSIGTINNGLLTWIKMY